MVADGNGGIATWRIRTNRRGLNIQTICSERDLGVELEMDRQLVSPQETGTGYLLVHKVREGDEAMVMVTAKRITWLSFDGDTGNATTVRKFKVQGEIIFATTIQK